MYLTDMFWLNLSISAELRPELCRYLPQDYKKQESPYLIVKVLEKAWDCSLHLEYGDYVVIERRMLVEIEIKGDKNYLVLENYIYGRLDDEAY